MHNIIKDISIIAEARPAESWFVVFLSYNYLLLFDLSFSHASTATAQSPHAILFLIKTRDQNKYKIKIYLEMYSGEYIIIIIVGVRIALIQGDSISPAFLFYNVEKSKSDFSNFHTFSKTIFSNPRYFSLEKQKSAPIIAV